VQATSEIAAHGNLNEDESRDQDVEDMPKPDDDRGVVA
jgi:hypothetical protein